jgi:hypothetical protein
MRSAPIIARPWDYGWLRRDVANFLPSDKDETGIHGPFVAARIHADDFVLLEQARLEDYVRGIELADALGENTVAHDQILPHLRSAFERHGKCYVLRRDERDKGLFHDGGFVLSVFREFLFVKKSGDGFERFVIGYD